MRKLILIIALFLISAAEARFPRGAPASGRIQKNLVTDYGAICNAKYGSPIITTSGTGNRNVFSSTAIFTPGAAPAGDVGKPIAIGGAGPGTPPGTYTGIIVTVTDSQNIVVSSDIATPKAGTASDLVWGTDNLSAYVAFKTDFQSTTPVQLNLPGNCGYVGVGGGFGKLIFEGIGDLIVAGIGSSTSGIASMSSGLLLGGRNRPCILLGSRSLGCRSHGSGTG